MRLSIELYKLKQSVFFDRESSKNYSRNVFFITYVSDQLGRLICPKKYTLCCTTTLHHIFLKEYKKFKKNRKT